MNSIDFIKTHIVDLIQEIFGLEDDQVKGVNVKIEVDSQFGDLSTNAAMVLAGKLNRSPKDVAEKIRESLVSDLICEHENPLSSHIKSVDIAGKGFLNIRLNDSTWHTIVHELFTHPERCFQLYPKDVHKTYLVEFVSANPTGPLSIAHGRNAIIGDVLCRVLKFIGHKVEREYYINDAGSQMDKLAASLKAQCQKLLGKETSFPKDGYTGQYIVDYASEIIKEYCISQGCGDKCSCDITKEDLSYFKEVGAKRMLGAIRQDLENYGVVFDNWFSEQSLYKDGKVENVLELLKSKGYTFEKDGCLWFRSTEFGDDKDRVLRKRDGSFTYVAPDIAYHKDKFDRGYDFIIDVLGQDHHSYANRLKAAMKALGFDVTRFKTVIYQLVSMKYRGKSVRMSKRAGVFESLSDVVKNVGRDVARYFFLNKKPDAHLEFDLELARSKDMNNPLFYIQYAYVRAKSVLEKASKDDFFSTYTQGLIEHDTDKISKVKEKESRHAFGVQEIVLLKKICFLRDVLFTVADNFHTHLVATYAYELAARFHSYYNSNKIVNHENLELSRGRLIVTRIVQSTLGLTLDLMGISKPDRM